MSEAQKGRLYRARGVDEPTARPALPEAPAPVSQPKSARIRQLSPLAVFAVLIIGLVLAATLEQVLLKRVGIATDVVFVLLSLLTALRAPSRDLWTAWTAPPIAIAIALLAGVLAAGADGGAIGIGFSLVSGLSDHSWVIVGGTALSLIVARRHYVRTVRAQRARSKSAKA